MARGKGDEELAVGAKIIRSGGFVINGYFAWRIVGRSRDRQADTDVHCSDGQLPVVTHGRTKRKYLHTRGLKLRSERGAYLGLGGEKGRARRGEKGDEEMQQMNKGKEGDGTRWWYGRPTRFIVA